MENQETNIKVNSEAIMIVDGVKFERKIGQSNWRSNIRTGEAFVKQSDSGNNWSYGVPPTIVCRSWQYGHASTALDAMKEVARLLNSERVYF